MGVQFNIKDAETVRKTRELASGSGRSMTEVIRAAIDREWREREDLVADKIRRANEIVDRIQAQLPEGWRGKTSKEIMDELYDEDGLPR
ncbi:type II toxin-antitoxin system VapB family antitoxin [Sphingomonas mollis]|uniref:Type II toxin-antitoxin system VapB family antitoxin n=1 Tax=Sphingomonas mollis TaxID=2795726 RepID=A0ABS0XKQ1_9SPHN|nr:type II toxin-antitoxin system VapB family antitoxin [Sphingomonas sp. BT553]MBJ6120623.1 type II toxin-antitoxin system VapB family antitoxin [Sphingomonas sp. BT553]